MKQFLFLTTFLLFLACNNKPEDPCAEQKMPNIDKDYDFVACKIDGKVWRSEAEKIWQDPVSAEFTDVSWCPKCVLLTADRKVKNNCDSIQDGFWFNWRNHQIGNNKIDNAGFLQRGNQYKQDYRYKWDIKYPYSFNISQFDSLKGTMRGSFEGILIGDKFNDTLKITEGVFKIGE